MGWGQGIKKNPETAALRFCIACDLSDPGQVQNCQNVTKRIKTIGCKKIHRAWHDIFHSLKHKHRERNNCVCYASLKCMWKRWDLCYMLACACMLAPGYSSVQIIIPRHA